MERRDLSLLTFTSLFPTPGKPNHGVFVRNRLEHLLASHPVQATVLAPVPQPPWALRDTAAAARGAAVLHPGFAHLRGLGQWTAPLALRQAGFRALAHPLLRGRRFDLIDAHYLYPDGVAALALGRRLGVPVIVTARGSDVTQMPDHPWPRRLIRRVIRESAALIAVSGGLRERLIELGAPADKVTVLRNGVDLTLFRPADRAAARAAFGLDGPSLVSVGGLIPRKRHDLTMAALERLPGWRLLIAGEGPERGRLEALATARGLDGRVRFLGALPHAELAPLYTAADVAVLASEREGWANVLLEAMACGTPVVASRIPGNPEVVAAPAAGRVVTANTPEDFAAAIREVASTADRAATRAYAEDFSWDATSAGQMALFRAVLARTAS
ncbi:MAG: glycosyltransferase [Rhodospirillales bacterium]|nr:glycosyltransferase [Rhodospirillales bacterium]